MIFYFTGTGNSLMAAKALAQDGERLVDMAKARKARDHRFDIPDGERIGFVFPVYWYTLPDVVLDFVRALEIGGAGRYVFSVITCGGGIAGAGAFLAKELAAKGLRLSYATPLLMPDCTVFYYNLETDENNASRLSAAGVRLSEIKAELEAKKEKKARGFFSEVMRIMYRASEKTKKFYATDACVGCGMCEKNCPDAAIEIRNGKPVWIKKNCTKCAACINRCPQKAIQYGKATEKRRRYVNPILK